MTMGRYPSDDVARFDQQFAETQSERNARLRAKRKGLASKDAMHKCVEWNTTSQIGADVIVTKDSGEEVRTKTRGEAYVCESGYPVIFLEGISGYYLLDRVRHAVSESDG